VAGLFAGGEVRRYRLSGAEWAGVRRLAGERYARWDWNVGAAPPYTVRRARRFAFGEVDVRLDVRRGRIAEARLVGDFLGTASVRPIEAALRGVPYDVEPLRRVVRGLDLSAAVPGLTPDDLLALLDPDAP
jgi:lipoate-protein ligase A